MSPPTARCRRRRVRPFGPFGAGCLKLCQCMSYTSYIRRCDPSTTTCACSRQVPPPWSDSRHLPPAPRADRLTGRRPARPAGAAGRASRAESSRPCIALVADFLATDHACNARHHGRTDPGASLSATSASRGTSAYGPPRPSFMSASCSPASDRVKPASRCPRILRPMHFNDLGNEQ